MSDINDEPSVSSAAKPPDPCAAAVLAVQAAQLALDAAQAVLALCRATNPPKASTSPIGEDNA